MSRSGYRWVQVAGDRRVHYAAEGESVTGCGCPVTRKLAGDLDAMPDRGGGRCGDCLVEWMSATGQIKLVSERGPNPLPPRR